MSYEFTSTVYEYISLYIYIYFLVPHEVLTGFEYNFMKRKETSALDT